MIPWVPNSILLGILSFLTLASSQSPSASTSASVNTSSVRPLGTRAHHGLKADGMQKNSIYVGVLPDWAHQSPISINQALGKSIAIIGDYIYVTLRGSTPFSQMQYHSPDVIGLKDYSVYAPAIIPNFALTSWTSEMSTNLAKEAAYFNTRGVNVWLRFAYEQNGEWMAYGQDPDTYKTVWREVATAVRDNPECNSTYMVSLDSVLASLLLTVLFSCGRRTLQVEMSILSEATLRIVGYVTCSLVKC